MPNVSIIIPIYNMENYLKECVQSIWIQDYNDYEIILVDDGSTDHSYQVALDLADEDDRIQVIHKGNEGVSAARNTGMGVATGTWIMFIDPDDTLTSNFFEKMLPFTIEEIDIVACCCYAVSEEIKDVDYFFSSDRSFVTFEEKKDLYKQLMDTHYGQPGTIYTAIGVPWGKLYRSSFLKEAKLKFNTRLKRYQDNIFNMYAFFYAREICYINQPLYNYQLEHIQKYGKMYQQGYTDYMYTLCEERYVCMKVLGLLKDGELKTCYCHEMFKRLWSILKNVIFTSENSLNFNEKKREANKICDKECFQPLFAEDIRKLTIKNKIKWTLMKFRMFRFISFFSGLNM